MSHSINNVQHTHALMRVLLRKIDFKRYNSMPIYKAKIILRSDARDAVNSILNDIRQQSSNRYVESEYEEFIADSRHEVIDSIIEKYENQLEDDYTSATVIFTDDSPLA